MHEGVDMTPTDYEWGTIESKVKELEHKIRNIKMIVDLLDDENEELRANVSRLKVEIRTALSVLGFVGSVLGYLFR
jgi:predicted RNase H-like nuclease (RuvC/YqgF family)